MTYSFDPFKKQIIVQYNCVNYHVDCVDKEFFPQGGVQKKCTITHTDHDLVAYDCDSMKKLGLCHLPIKSACNEDMSTIAVKELCQLSCDNCYSKYKRGRR